MIISIDWGFTNVLRARPAEDPRCVDFCATGSRRRIRAGADHLAEAASALGAIHTERLTISKNALAGSDKSPARR
jgi:hypothetical protein